MEEFNALRHLIENQNGPGGSFQHRKVTTFDLKKFALISSK